MGEPSSGCGEQRGRDPSLWRILSPELCDEERQVHTSSSLGFYTQFGQYEMFYYQILLSPSAIPKTAIITPFGSWDFKVLPFGVCNAVPSFQCIIDCVMVGIPFLFCYLEDLLIFSPDEETHEKHLRIVLQHLWDAGLAANPHKSTFFRSSVEYLGHTILEFGISPLPHHTAADFSVPEDVQQLQRFISMANFYWSFLLPSDRPLQEACAVQVGAPGAGPVFWLPASPTTNSAHLYA